MIAGLSATVFLLAVRKEVWCTFFNPGWTVVTFLAGVVLRILLTQGIKWFGVHIFRLVLAMWVHIIVRRRLSKFIPSSALKVKFKSSRQTHGLSILGYIDVMSTFRTNVSDATCLRLQFTPFCNWCKHLPQILLQQHCFEILLFQTLLWSLSKIQRFSASTQCLINYHKLKTLKQNCINSCHLRGT